ncbi:MAG: Uma2 family endonuclease [Anaerolineae bacterium]|nr:Uma2 family endonuclease [Anaerolineae bacterium]
MTERLAESFCSLEEFWSLAHAETGDLPRCYELDEGMVIEMSPSGALHGILAAWISYLLNTHVYTHGLGLSFGAETGFILHQAADGRAIVRAPDFAFVSKARALPVSGKFYPTAPDFAVEIVSPSDTARQMRRKARQYLAYGTRLLWIVFPDEPDRFVDVYRPEQPILTVQGEQLLEGYDVLPNFALPVNRLFAALSA